VDLSASSSISAAIREGMGVHTFQTRKAVVPQLVRKVRTYQKRLEGTVTGTKIPGDQRSIVTGLDIAGILLIYLTLLRETGYQHCGAGLGNPS
jgi:hypothetical protein